MKRLKQLLAKGIDNIDEAESAELAGLMSPEKMAEYTDAEVAEIEAAIRASAEELIEDDEVSEAINAAIEQLANLLDVVKAAQDERANAAAEAEARKQALRDRIRGAEPEVDEVEGDGDEPPAGEVDENGDPIEVVAIIPAEVEPVPEPIAASTPAPSRLNVRRPANRNPRPRTDARQAPIVAAAGLSGVQPGQPLDTNDKLFRAFDSAVQLARSNSAQGDWKQPIIQLRSEIPDEFQLDRDAERNERLIEKRMAALTAANNGALVAAGGACAPVPYRYDLPTVGDDSQPVRDSLVRYGAQRAGISLFIPPTITDVQGTGATTSAVSQWTYANDVTPGSDGPSTKPYLRIDCGNNEAQVTRVYAVVTQYEAGNMLERWDPELIQAYVNLIGVWGARFSEAKRLAAIAAFSKVVTHGQVLGSASDIFPALDQLIMGIRYRHRIPAPVTMHVTGFEWVRNSIITDLIRRGSADRPVEERLRMAIGEIAAFFAARNCNVTWSPDFQYGVALGSPGGPPAGAQGVGPVIGYPSVARFYVYIEGSVLFLDGGEFRIGTMRDVTKVRTNDWVFFSETFENVVYHGVPGECYAYDMDICANGGYSSALDISPCVTNS